MLYISLFIFAFLLSAALIPILKKLAFYVGAVDHPNADRKIHKQPIPLLGGFAVFVSFVILDLVYVSFFQKTFDIIPLRFHLGIIFGGLILMIGGFLDDKFGLLPRFSFISPMIAAVVLVWFGVGSGITTISNPLGQPVNLKFFLLGLHFSSIFVFIFVLGMIYTTKFLDGLDGLASGIALISGLTLFFLSLTPRINQSITASLAIIFSGATLGFLIYNFNPASIFLGEAGSTFMGFMLGALAVLLGGKIATAVLVMGIPILDVAWVIFRRLWYGASPFRADRKHLHFRLLDIGFSQRQTVFILYGIAATFGFVAIFLQSLGKLIALAVLLCVMLALAIGSVAVYRKKYNSKPV